MLTTLLGVCVFVLLLVAIVLMVAIAKSENRLAQTETREQEATHKWNGLRRQLEAAQKQAGEKAAVGDVIQHKLDMALGRADAAETRANQFGGAYDAAQQEVVALRALVEEQGGMLEKCEQGLKYWRTQCEAARAGGFVPVEIADSADSKPSKPKK